MTTLATYAYVEWLTADNSEEERAAELADWESLMDAHLRPPDWEDYYFHCEFMEAA